MGRLFCEVLEGRKYVCKECLATGAPRGNNVVHLAAQDSLLSKNFHSRNGPAYLFDSVVNVAYGPPEEREMTTGRHVVRSCFCICCGSELGWVYDVAYEPREKYKQGKVVLERLRLVDLDAAAAATSAAAAATAAISAASPGSSPGSAGLGSDPGHSPPHPAAANGTAAAAAGRELHPYQLLHPHHAVAAVGDDPTLPELRAFFSSWAPAAGVPPVPPPFNLNDLNLSTGALRPS